MIYFEVNVVFLKIINFLIGLFLQKLGIWKYMTDKNYNFIPYFYFKWKKYFDAVWLRGVIYGEKKVRFEIA
jgi:hypothetical protein